jgi:hypothetical protein
MPAPASPGSDGASELEQAVLIDSAVKSKLDNPRTSPVPDIFPAFVPLLAAMHSSMMQDGQRLQAGKLTPKG